MLIKFITFLRLIDIFAGVFNWVEIHTLSYDLDLLIESIRRVELQVTQVDEIVDCLENQFDINLYSFRAEKDRLRLESIFNS
jgi:uncharacterized protein CbrC (UPF0167 family)